MVTTLHGGARVRAPWHFWLVAVIAILWNGFGAYDYVMSHSQGDAYYASMGMTPAQIAYAHAMPAWVVAAWAFGVWGAVAGSVLLLLRSRWALHAFVVSLLGLLASLVYSQILTSARDIMGTTAMIMNVVVLAGCLFFVWYARMMAARGTLR